MRELLKLAERCEQATGPDRELDCVISRALIEVPEGCKAVHSDLTSQAGVIVDRVGRIYGTVYYQPFTASVDAALALVPDGFEWRAQWSELPDRTWAGIAGVQGINTTAATPALALCAAALRAQEADDAE